MAVMADFAVRAEEQSQHPYGNAQTKPFHHAITGGPMTSQERTQLTEMLPIRDEQRYYGRVRLNSGTLTFDRVKNHSLGSYHPGAVVKNRSIRNQIGLEFAAGYIWSSSLRGDIEYLLNRNLEYNVNPALSGVGVPPTRLSSELKNNTILANAYYELAGISHFKPYVTAGIGLSSNSVRASVASTAPNGLNGGKSARKISLAWGGGVGIRLGFFSHWFVDMSYRYLQLGRAVKVQPISSLQLNGYYTMSAISLGIICVF